MKLHVTFTSPYARLARILVLEKALEDRVDVIEAKTRVAGSPYYQINPSGRVPYLINDDGVGMEDSQPICAYLDSRIDEFFRCLLWAGSAARRSATLSKRQKQK